MSKQPTLRWPKVKKEYRVDFRAKHDFRGFTRHPEGMAGEHEHDYRVIVYFEHEINPWNGYARDEYDIEQSWGRRIGELRGTLLNDFTAPFPPSDEILAHWLLWEFLPALSPNELNFEVVAVRVSKAPHHFSSLAERSHGERQAWINCGGLVV